MAEDDGKPTDESVPEGKKDNKPVENTDTSVEAAGKHISLYDKTEALITEEKELLKKREEIITREETLFANQRLAGTTGGNVVPKEPEQISDSDYADKLMRGEANPLEEDGISLNS